MNGVNLFKTIYTRKSIRNYIQEKLEWDLLEDILNYINQLPMLIDGIGTEIKLISNIEEKQGFTGPFTVKAPYYICISSEEREGHLLNAGYLMQHINLYIQSRGLGACFLGATKPGKELSSTMKYKYIISLAFGKSSEILHRDSSEAKRLPEEKLIVYKEDTSSDINELLTAARLAPSSLNSQPWRFVAYNNRIHVFAKKYPLIVRPVSKIKMLDMGIMLANMLIAADELWINVEFKKLESIATKKFKNNEYLVSLIVK